MRVPSCRIERTQSIFPEIAAKLTKPATPVAGFFNCHRVSDHDIRVMDSEMVRRSGSLDLVSSAPEGDYSTSTGPRGSMVIMRPTIISV